MSLFGNWSQSIVQNIIAGIFFIWLIKIGFYFICIMEYLGEYRQVGDNTCDQRFTVRSNFFYCLIPIPHMRISISKYIKSNEQWMEEWTGVYFSDILNAYFFKGLYNIPKAQHGKNGWHEINFLRCKRQNNIKKRMVAVNIHFLEMTNPPQWNNTGGYELEKCTESVLCL